MLVILGLLDTIVWRKGAEQKLGEAKPVYLKGMKDGWEDRDWPERMCSPGVTGQGQRGGGGKRRTTGLG